jgi:hypothetical protein
MSAPQRRDGVHHQPAFVFLRPQPDALAVVLRLSVDAQRMRVERRPHRLEAEGGDVGLRRVAPQQVHQQRRDQRAMHDEAWVALDLGHVGRKYSQCHSGGSAVPASTFMAA